MARIVSTLVQVHVARFIESRWEHLLLRRSLEDTRYPGLWQCITGHIHQDETAFGAAQRELTEEIGVAALQWWSLPITGTYYDRETDTLSLTIAFGAVIAPTAILRLSEHCDYRWLCCAEARRIVPIPAQQDGIAMLERFLADSAHRTAIEQLYRLQ